MNKTSDIRVLIAPGHYQADSASGSEYGWARETIRRIAPHVKSVIALTGFTREPIEGVRLISVWTEARELNHIRRLWFVACYTAEAYRRGAVRNADVIHHVFPFAVGRTFNPIALLNQDKPFVIGPVQQSLNVDVSDEASVTNRSVDSEGNVTFGSSKQRLVLDRFLEIGASLVTKLSAATLRRADLIICTSEKAKQECLDLVPEARVAVMPRGIDVDQFQPPPTEKSANELVVVGYLVKRKRVDLLIRAIAALRKEGVEARLRVVGDGPEREALEKLCADLGVQDRVIFDGMISNSEVPALYARAVASCLVSSAEAAATTPLESLACGTPVICSDTGIMGDLLRKHSVGVLVEPTVESIASAISRLVSNPDLVMQMSSKGRELMQTEYDSSLAGNRFAETYRVAIEARAGRH